MKLNQWSVVENNGDILLIGVSEGHPAREDGYKILMQAVGRDQYGLIHTICSCIVELGHPAEDCRKELIQKLKLIGSDTVYPLAEEVNKAK